MPFSKKHNVLFIHIPKCAGKSLEVALNIADENEVQKYRWRSNINRASKFLLTITRDKKAKNRLWGTYDVSLALQHLTYTEIELLNLLSDDILSNSIKVAIVRNPFDRAVSSFRHMGKTYKTFLDFLEDFYISENKNHGDLSHKRSQVDFLRNKKGEIAVTNLIRFENLHGDLKQFANRNNLSIGEIPHLGKDHDRLEYRKYYCEKSRQIVEKLFEDDLRLLNYNF